MKIKIFLLSLLLSISFVSLRDVNVCSASSSYEYDKQVSDVINLINALPNKCTLENEKDVKNARLAYDNLLPSQKVNVTNLLILLEKESQIATLYSEISYVVALIDSLPSVDEIELTDEITLNSVIDKYNKYQETI